MLILCLSLIFLRSFSSAFLRVNVRNQGGELIEETLSGNVTEDFTTLEFIKADGTIITHLVDFRNEVQIFQALVLGEEERGQSQYQVMCFVTKVDKGDYIASDAIAKLRQKNPHAERQAEEDLSEVGYQMEVLVHLNRSAALSPHIAQLCGEAAGATYSRHEDVRHVADRRAADLDAGSLDLLELAVSTPGEPCRCRYHVCVSWYPCSLKYCKGHEPDGQTVSYRCGIRTCRRCHVMDYRVARKQLCLWDEEPRGEVNLMGREEDDL
ncbi:out at first protein-like [Pollicipes pollicipes]|uniref:out at first protein-like n=1 Tax=Pollicipes pollicipes TaxID=41117 RepID=UPI001884978E|nr:out at first protein-like [Pollicipes pollicipes]